MNRTDFVSIRKIKANKAEDRQKICETLKEILSKIVANVDDSRQISLLDEKIVDYLMPYDGGLEALFEIGFIENDDHFTLPKEITLDSLRIFLCKLDELNDDNSMRNSLTDEQAEYYNHADLHKMSKKHQGFYMKLQNSFNHVWTYENRRMQDKALKLIPVDDLKQKSLEKYDAYRKSLSKDGGVNEVSAMEFLLIELLDWYKNEFFQWVNQPDCDQCTTKEFMKFEENSTPNAIETYGWANNVEVYRCTRCNGRTRFPRFNNPETLLVTRKGRCGEWANCFALCLRALNIETRYVLDWTDHVWCEVYSSAQKRWLHIDPCEAALDKPLVYENGWGKKLTYVIGFSIEEIIDCTWRYSTNHVDILKRRTECDELWLVNLTNKMTRHRQSKLDRNRIAELELRKVTEIVEFLTPKTTKDGENIGRQSGSLAWRLSRGETGENVVNKSYAFKLNDGILNTLKYDVKYNCAKDVYVIDDGKYVFKIWNSLTNSYSNVQRKVENDWKKCYLSRTSGSTTAFIEWMFDFTDYKTLIKASSIKLKCQSQTFENGQIKWTVACDEKYIVNVEKTNQNVNIIDNIETYYQFKIRAFLSNGSGDNAFQHTQLFRQDLDDYDSFLFHVEFCFDKV